MGGEKFCAPSLVCCHTGSPPHGRGKVRLQEQDCRSGGITPAWAGKSHLTGGDRVLLRITPAWAGKSPFQTWSVPHSRDHPRMGGEKSAFAMLRALVFGSPPHGRGKVGTVTAALGDLGITPAWAGKRSSLDGKMFKIWDHPRVGGEKSISCWKRSMPVGSPPRGRGKVAYIGNKNGLDGITPAWAGKRFKNFFIGHIIQDHPRVGGEKSAVSCKSLTLLGSPPRGRGKDIAALPTIWIWGITPAWAGKRLKRSHRSGIFISGPIPFHSVLHRPAGSGGSRAGRDGSPAGQPQNTGPA